MQMSGLTVPVIAVVTGEGSSGGALALGVANHILMLENAVYAVASPEACAAILWKEPPAPALRERLKRAGFDVIALPVNPYI